MLSAQFELSRIQSILTADRAPDRYNELYAAQQALVWILDPATFKAPSDMLVIGTQGDSEDCPEGTYHSEFSDSRGHRAA